MNASAGLSRTYLVECYVPGIKPAEVECEVARVRAVSAELRKEGRQVEYVGAILVPGDEVVFHLFASECEGTVRDASVRASVPYERVVESIAVGRPLAEDDT
jgi:hypothetical protein